MLRFLPRNHAEISPASLAALRPYGGVMARLLAARGIAGSREAEAFLNPSPGHLHDPLALHHMDRALEILGRAKEKGIAAVVYGDYDVDGMCANALLCDALTRFGLSVRPHVPLRGGLRPEQGGCGQAGPGGWADHRGIWDHQRLRGGFGPGAGHDRHRHGHHQLSLAPAQQTVIPLCWRLSLPQALRDRGGLLLAQAAGPSGSGGIPTWRLPSGDLAPTGKTGPGGFGPAKIAGRRRPGMGLLSERLRRPG